MSDVLKEIRAEEDQSDASCSLDHLQYVFEGYRDWVIGLGNEWPDARACDRDKYSPGSARDISYKIGIRWAMRDITEAKRGK